MKPQVVYLGLSTLVRSSNLHLPSTMWVLKCQKFSLNLLLFAEFLGILSIGAQLSSYLILWWEIAQDF